MSEHQGMVEVEVTALAAGGDGVARDEGGRVTFVPRTAVGDRVRVKLVKEAKSFARGELVDIVAPSADRVEAPCEYFRAGCGGCQWQHVSRAAQLAAKQAIVAGALRNLTDLAIEPVADPAPPYGWRRRARFHVVGGKVGLYATASHRVIPIEHCPQLEPELDAAVRVVAAASPPDGELAFVRAHDGAIAVGVERAWRGAASLVGRARIVGVLDDDHRHGTPIVEIEPGLWTGPWDFAQASAAGNAAMIAIARAALGRGPGRLLELHAGAGNFTRAFVEDRWDVLATDVAAPPKPIDGARFETGKAERVLARSAGPFDAIVLDPPRTGAAEAVEGIVKHAPKVIVYISCDPATLGRDAARLVAAGYRAERAWPIDLMPQTSHVEVVMRLVKA
ncbi:MAG: class I SAM-dependent RNA methyltransferase [Kofleriaceae bacterium]|nr:class I SAM-dependent RNA methyltransferase [Kofleriaceae bacterium]